MYCLQSFTTEEILNQHKENCMVINSQQPIKMPNKCKKIMFKFIKDNYKHHLSYMQILKQLPKKFNHANLMMMFHIQKLIKNTQTVYMHTKSFVAMIKRLPNQFNFMEAKMLYTILWKNVTRSMVL